MTKENQIKFDFTNWSDPKNALLCFAFASMTYKSQQGIKEELRKFGYNNIKAMFFKSNLTAGFIFECDDFIVVSFRGSSTWREWLNNCNMWLQRTEDGRVHSGFWTTVEQIAPSIFEIILPRLRPGIKLVVTGHSRGGALAALFQFIFKRHISHNKLGDYPAIVNMFGAPKFCDEDFCAAMNGDASIKKLPNTSFEHFLLFMHDFATNVYCFIMMFIWLLHFVFFRRMKGIDAHSVSSYEKSIHKWVAWDPVVQRLKALTAERNPSCEEETISRNLNGTEVKFITNENLQVALQPWQQRRLETIKTVRGFNEGDPSAKTSFDALLTEFETRPFARTPLENMQIISAFYVPKDGFEKCMPAVIANAVLGWYDALRFASASGQAEIIHNEGFFKMAFTLGGKNQEAVNFFRNNPDKITESLVQGFLIAERFRESSEYDHLWPSAYGLEGVISTLDGTCKNTSTLPIDQWDNAWEEAKKRIAAYYQPAFR